MTGRFFLFLFSFAWLFISCGGDKSSEKKQKTTEEPKPQSALVQPTGNRFTIGDTITVEIQNDTEDWTIDSVQVFVKDQLMGVVKEAPYSLRIPTSTLPVGRLNLRSATYFNDRSTDIDHKSVTLLSDIEPQRYTYRIVRRFPHARRAFTQGLLYHNGFLYEGTGQKGESSVRKVNLRTGEILQIKYLSSDYFGEGITLYDNKLIQLTWKARKGFVYNLDDLSLVKEFRYPTEGWGITTIGDTLFMSDGSSTLYKLDAQNFNGIGRVEVYNQFGPVSDLNELEYIKGEIYANVYQTDEIVIIDPVTGKVTGVIDLTGLLNLNMVSNDIDVLNGIAYDADGDRLFVTGKYWSYVFEINLIREEPTAYSSVNGQSGI